MVHRKVCIFFNQKYDILCKQQIQKLQNIGVKRSQPGKPDLAPQWGHLGQTLFSYEMFFNARTTICVLFMTVRYFLLLQIFPQSHYTHCGGVARTDSVLKDRVWNVLGIMLHNY